MRSFAQKTRILGAVLVAASGTGSFEAMAGELAGKAVGVSGKVLVRKEGESGGMRFLKVGDPIEKGTIINTGSNASAKLLMTDKSIVDLGGTTLFKVDEYVLKNGADRNVQMSMDYGKIRASVNTPVSASGRFNIKTRSATMGVRGTEFIVAAGDPQVSKGSTSSAPAAPSSGGSSGPAGVQGPQQTTVTVVHGKVDVTTAPLSPSAGAAAGNAATAAAKPQTVALTAGTQLMAASIATQPLGGERGLAAIPAAVAPPQITQLSPTELASVKSEVKFETGALFTQAIEIKPQENSGGGNREGPQPGANGAPAPLSAGAATLGTVVQNLSTNIAAAPIQLNTTGGIVGAFNPQQLANNPALNANTQNNAFSDAARVSVRFTVPR